MLKRIQSQDRQQKLNCQVYLVSAMPRSEYIDEHIINYHEDRSLPFHTDKTSTTIIYIVDTEYNRKHGNHTIGKQPCHVEQVDFIFKSTRPCAAADNMNSLNQKEINYHL